MEAAENLMCIFADFFELNMQYKSKQFKKT